MTQGVLMLDLKGLYPDSMEIDRLSRTSVGGVILFSRNYRDADQLQQLIAAVRAIRPDMLIAVDQEGGRVQRFRQGHFTRLPPMGVFGNLYQTSDYSRFYGISLALGVSSSVIASTWQLPAYPAIFRPELKPLSTPLDALVNEGWWR